MDIFSARGIKAEEQLLLIAASIDEFEGYENQHARRISLIADALAKKFNFGLQDRFYLRQAALVHDIGEIVMNRNYIKNQSELHDNERVDMQRHPVIGEQEVSKRGLNRAVQLFVRWHHEWWNGSGYPDALEREQIPLSARILRVADTYASMTDARPYRQAFSASEATQHLIEWAGIAFDPQIVKAFISLEDINELESFSKEI